MGTHVRRADAASGISKKIQDKPLSALLSQALVAFTLEFDNEFERRMIESGHRGERLSLVVWSNLIRFLDEGGVSVLDLAARAMASQERIKFQLGCLERWRFVSFTPASADERPIPQRAHSQTRHALREGWGSGRGIRGNWIVNLTSKGLKAKEIWTPLSDEIERRWRTRFGKELIGRLCESLQAIVVKLDIELPDGLPGYWMLGEAEGFPPRKSHETARLPLPALLSQMLLWFTIEFDRESDASLALSANVLRVIGQDTVGLGDIPRLTGGSPEMTAISWQLKPYVLVEPDPSAKRGKVVRLTPRGLKAQKHYHRLVGEIEKRWEAKFGQGPISRLRESLQELFTRRDGVRPLMSAGLVPPEGTVRAGRQAPALGRRDVGAAARQRMLDLVAQTETFVRDPAGALPHYPLWDMNRGFGP